EEDEITPEATLVGDLGAESIDFLDIVFRLEKAFGIKIPRGELFPESLTAADENFVQDGVVTDEGLTQLREKLPYADVDAFAEDPKVENIMDLFTVNMIVNFLDARVNS
ncbi:MAG: phosphopantetheine-binding protein, partial [Planctomycetota bacterium]